MLHCLLPLTTNRAAAKVVSYVDYRHHNHHHTSHQHSNSDNTDSGESEDWNDFSSAGKESSGSRNDSATEDTNGDGEGEEDMFDGVDKTIKEGSNSRGCASSGKVTKVKNYKGDTTSSTKIMKWDEDMVSRFTIITEFPQHFCLSSRPYQ